MQTQCTEHKAIGLEQRILVVDDDREFADSVVELLETRGYCPVAAYSASDACQAAEERPFEIGLLDIRLGKDSGVEVLRALRELWPGMLCILITGYAEVETAIDALRYGAYDYLSKPVSPPHLLAVLQRAFSRIRVEREKSEAEEALRNARDQLEDLVDERTAHLIDANRRLKLEIAERIRLERELDRFFALSVDGLCILDLSGRIRRISPSFATTLGFEPGELVGTSVLDLVHEEDKTKTAEEFERLSAGEVVLHLESRCRTRQNVYKWLEWSVVPSPGNGALYAVARDTTKRRETEDAMRAAEHRLRQAEHLASLGTLSAGIAHEINNPVGMISLAAENAVELSQTDPQGRLLQSCLKDIIQNADRCGRIVRNVLKFAKRELTDRWANNVNEVIARAVDRVTALPTDQDVQLDLRLADDLPKIQINPIEFEQVFANLLHNAIQAAIGSVRVTIETTIFDNGIRVIVADNGRGIPHDEVERVFDPFYTTRREKGGTGLGLSIVHGIITSHGGTIKLDSRPDVGTKFTIELPLAPVETKHVQGTDR